MHMTMINYTHLLQPQHKVQSSGELQLKFSHTPKMLLLLTSKWVPKAFVVTFKVSVTYYST